MTLSNGTSVDGNILVCTTDHVDSIGLDDSLPDEASLSDSSISTEISTPIGQHRSMITSVQPTNPVINNPLETVEPRVSSTRRRSIRLLNRLFSRGSTVQLHVSPPSKADRTAYFAPVLIQWVQKIGMTYPERNRCLQNNRPPSPLPVPESPNISASGKRPLKLTREELCELEYQEAQLFRRLRQVLRRVVAHLARHRRFAVFARPVQVDEAPDYYEVIKHPMDLGTIRDRIDADRYRNVDDFMKDIELIYYNALEYNPANVPRSRDIRSRASEFWDEACLQLEEELNPRDLNERCKEAVEAQNARAMRETAKSNPSEENGAVSGPLRSADPNQQKTGTSQEADSPAKLYPMPLGGRYSRRLHGEPPVLETKDVHLLEQISGRRSASLSQSLVASETSQLTSKSGSNEMDLDKCDDQIHKPRLDHHIDHKITLVSSLQYLPHSGNCLAPNMATWNISSPVQPQRPMSTSPTLSVSPTIELHSTNMGPDMDKLTAFHEAVVNGTTGWPVNQLIRLHAEFCAVLSVNQANPDHLLMEFERVFKTYVKRNLTVELPV
ncbi:unnamed protein product [Echinostoma caproni]|uniref:Bromo domain-containing protein n=1 Tax=Echinostoma caproni TaxID=27848 RepID=A0A183AEU2_9TREM|nr:unnamed protein product [Echinostoma caproni]